MKLDKETKKIISDYEKELSSKKRLTKEEVENYINNIKNDPYESYRNLIQGHLYLAYEIALKYKAEELTTLDFIHCANEGLEIGVTTRSYNDYDSFIKEMESEIKETIDLMLSYL